MYFWWFLPLWHECAYSEEEEERDDEAETQCVIINPEGRPQEASDGCDWYRRWTAADLGFRGWTHPDLRNHWRRIRMRLNQEHSSSGHSAETSSCWLTRRLQMDSSIWHVTCSRLSRNSLTLWRHINKSFMIYLFVHYFFSLTYSHIVICVLLHIK